MGRKILSTLVFGFICFATINHFILASENSEKTKAQINYILISSEDLARVNVVLRRSIRTLLPNAQETYLDYNSAEAEKYIKELDVKFVPFVIYDDSIVTTDTFFHMVRNKMVNKVKGYYVIPDEQLRLGEIMFLGRERQPNKLCMFAMSFCPYTKEAEVRLINFIRQNKLGITLNIKYLVDFHEFGVSSRHGPEEIKEDIRQIVIQKYYPGKFLDYLLLIQNKQPQAALKDLNISLEDIDSKKDEALKMLKEDSEESKILGIKRSPTFLWENVFLIPNLEDLKRHKPFNRKKVQGPGKKNLSGPIPIDFFYSDGCRACLGIKQDLLPKVKARYKDRVVINYHNISDADAFKLKLTMEKEYGILKGSIPQIFLPTVALIGKNAIRKDLAGAIEKLLELKSRSPRRRNISEKGPILDKFSTFSPAIIAFAGLADGINPCAFATMVFFVSFLTLNSYRKKQIVYIGSTFIVGVFLTYLTLGFGIFQAFKKLQIFSFFSQLIYYFIALLALGLGTYNLCDYIRYRRTGEVKGCSLKLYNRLRSLVDNRKGLIILIIGTFVSGFMIALLESACTGQVYFPTIAFVIKVPSLRTHAFLYLVLYNILFILPLVAIFLLAYRGINSEKVTLFTNKHLGKMKLTYALLFFGLAIFLFLS